MSGMEMIALSAALGAGVGGISAANKGGNPLEGALLGGATGAAGGALGGAFAPAAGTVGGTAAQAFPVAMDAAIPAVALDAAGGATANLMAPVAAEMAAPYAVSGSMIPDLAAMDANMAVGNIAQTAGVQPPVATGLTAAAKKGMAKDLLGMVQGFGGQDQRQAQIGQIRPPQMKQASAPQIAAPIASLLQERERMPRRRISLL